MSQTIYEVANINGREARKTYFLAEDGSKVLLPKNAKYSHSIGDITFTATFNTGKCFEKISKMLECESFYDPAEAVAHILSGTEAFEENDPNYDTDAFLYYSPTLDTKHISEMNMEDVLDRYAWFVKVCHMVSEPDMLKKVIESATKKKNGTFYKNRIVEIAAFPVVISKELIFFELIGKTDNDTNITVTVKKRVFTEDIWIKIKDNNFLSFVDDKNPATFVKFWHYRMHNSKKIKTTIEIQAIKMDDGRLAINTKPYRAISDFKCVKGNDNNGYEIFEPTNINETQIIDGKKYRIDREVKYKYCGIWSIFEYMEEPILYLRTGKKKYELRADIHLALSDNPENKKRNLTENYFNEELYQLLCVLDDIYDFLHAPDVFEKVAYHINKSKNICSYIPVPSCKDRKIPLVTGEIGAMKPNEYEDSIVIFYRVGSRNLDTWSEYEDDT